MPPAMWLSSAFVIMTPKQVDAIAYGNARLAVLRELGVPLDPCSKWSPLILPDWNTGDVEETRPADYLQAALFCADCWEHHDGSVRARKRGKNRFEARIRKAEDRIFRVGFQYHGDCSHKLWKRYYEATQDPRFIILLEQKLTEVTDEYMCSL